MMKNRLKMFAGILLSGAMAAAVLTGCGGSGKVNLENPMKSVESVEAFSKMDVSIDAPGGAKDIKYYTIGKTLAQVDFTLDGTSYSYRGAKTDEDISGVYDEFTGDPMKITTKGGNEIDIKTTTTDAKLATWKISDKSYSLLATENAKGESMAVLSQQLAQAQEEK